MTGNRKVALRFALALSVLLVVNAVAYLGARKAMESADQLARAHKVLDGLQGSVAGLEDAEADLAVFVIGGQAKRLQAHWDAVRRSREQLAALSTVELKSPER